MESIKLWEYFHCMDLILHLSLLVFSLIQVSSVQSSSTPDQHYIHKEVLYQYHPTNLTQSQASQTCWSRGLTLLRVSDGTDHQLLANITAILGIRGTFWIQGRGHLADWHWVSDQSRLSNQGCYKDYGGSPDLPREVQLQNVVPELCVIACGELGYLYAGLQSGYQCFCGNSYGKYNLSQGAPWCSVSCEGDPDKYCGGWNRNTVYYINGSFSSWAYQQPDNMAGDESCAVVESVSLDHQFSDESCYYLYSYICDIPLHNCSETANYHQESSECYYLGSVAKSWFNARSDCMSRGGDLMKIYSSETFTALQNILAENERTEKHWTGLVNKDWLTESNELMETFFWLDEQPGHADWECLSHVVNGQGWVNTDCEELLPFICTKDLARAEDTMTTSPNTTMSSVKSSESTGQSTTFIMMSSSLIVGETTQSTLTSLQPRQITDLVETSSTISDSDSNVTTSVETTAVMVTFLSNPPESGQQTESEGWTIQKIVIVVGVLGGIFLATTVVGIIVLCKLKCRPSHNASSSTRVCPAEDDKTSSDKNHNSDNEKGEMQRLEQERKAAMAVTCSDVKVNKSERSLESLC